MGIKAPQRPFRIEDCIVYTREHVVVDEASFTPQPVPRVEYVPQRDTAHEEYLSSQLVSVRGDLEWANGEISRLKARPPDIVETIREIPTTIEKEIVKVVIRTPVLVKWLAPLCMVASYLIGKYLHL